MEATLPDLDKPLSLAELRQLLRQRLTPKYGDREATAMSREIIMHLKGWSLTRLIADEEKEASDFVKQRANEILKLLMQYMPLQYALGETTFHGLTLKVRPGVLIPRPETEELVDLIVKENSASDLRVLDLCTGSGAIAVALARALPFCRMDAVDFSDKALEVARENAADLKVNVTFTLADVFKLKLPPATYDIIVSNPPYVDRSEMSEMEPNVLDYEPHEALFVDDDTPLVFYEKICSLAATALKEGGRLYFEINPRHAAELKRLIGSSCFSDVTIIKDTHGKDRFASAIKE